MACPGTRREHDDLLARLRRTLSLSRLGPDFFDEEYADFVDRLASTGPVEMRTFAVKASAAAQELIRRRRKRDEQEWAQ
eukprot:11247603-Heterocapsa_arctica.AAC.1